VLNTEETSFMYYPIHSNTPTLTSLLSPIFHPLKHTQIIYMKNVMLYTEDTGFTILMKLALFTTLYTVTLPP
jgi:hypothetical protein